MAERRRPVWPGYFADPFLTTFEGGYIAYGSGDPELGVPGFEAIRSPDLVSWSPVGRVFDGADPALGDGYWAPEVAHADGAWWMYYSVGHGIGGHHIRVARSESPLGPFVDTGVNLTPEEPFAIDAHPFRDVDGSWYLYFARDVIDAVRPGTQLAVKRMTGMASVEAVTTTVLQPDSDWQIYARARRMYGRELDWHTLEGPTVVRHGDGYVLFFSGGSWETDGYGVSVATAPHPLGPWMHPVAPEADLPEFCAHRAGRARAQLRSAACGRAGPDRVPRLESGAQRSPDVHRRARLARRIAARRSAVGVTGRDPRRGIVRADDAGSHPATVDCRGNPSVRTSSARDCRGRSASGTGCASRTARGGPARTTRDVPTAHSDHRRCRGRRSLRGRLCDRRFDRVGADP